MFRSKIFISLCTGVPNSLAQLSATLLRFPFMQSVLSLTKTISWSPLKLILDSRLRDSWKVVGESNSWRKCEDKSVKFLYGAFQGWGLPKEEEDRRLRVVKGANPQGELWFSFSCSLYFIHHPFLTLLFRLRKGTLLLARMSGPKPSRLLPATVLGGVACPPGPSAPHEVGEAE